MRALFAELRLAFQLVPEPGALHAPFVALNVEILELAEAGRARRRRPRLLRSYLDRAEALIVATVEAPPDVRVRPVGAGRGAARGRRPRAGRRPGGRRVLDLVADGVAAAAGRGRPRRADPAARRRRPGGGRAALLRPARASRTRTCARDAPVVEVPAVYDGADLAEVAPAVGLTSEAEVVARHTATEFRVAFCGFAPGFPYLVGLDGAGAPPADAPPRPCRPARSVSPAATAASTRPPPPAAGSCSAAPRCGCSTSTATRRRCCRRAPGCASSRCRRRLRPRAPGEAGAQPPTGRALTVVRPGGADHRAGPGRPGLAHLGVPRPGALDERRRPAGQPARRQPRGRGRARDDGRRRGAARVDGRDGRGHRRRGTGDGRRPRRRLGRAVGVPAGSVVDVGAAVTGLRSYVAVAGRHRGRRRCSAAGRADTLSGLGPPPLAGGRRAAGGRPAGPAAGGRLHAAGAASPEPVVLRLAAGPRDRLVRRDGARRAARAAVRRCHR